MSDPNFEGNERASEVQRLWNRLKSFERLQDGWLEDKGRAPTQLALLRAREILTRLLVDYRSVELPGVYPTPSGGVQAEWVLGPWAAEIYFDPEDGGIEAEATQSDTGEERRARFTCDQVTAADVTLLAKWLDHMG